MNEQIEELIIIREQLREMVADMKREIAKEYWSQTTGDTVDANAVKKWANELEQICQKL